MRMPRVFLLLIAALCCCVGVLGPAEPAWAQSAQEKAGARALAKQGVQAYKAGDYAGAIRYFQRAEKIYHALPHLLWMAKAQVEVGKLVEANDNLLKIKNETLPATAPPAFARAQEEAVALIPQVKPRLPYLTVNVEGLPEGQDVEIDVDGSRWTSVFVGVPRAVNPGEHQVFAIADGLKSEAQSVKLDESGQQTISLQLQADSEARITPLEPAGEAAPVAGTAPAGEPAPGDPMQDQPADAEPSGGGFMTYAPYIALGVGAIGLTMGAIFASSSASKRSDADKLFDENCADGCTTADPVTEEIAQLDDDAGSAKTLAIVGFAIGGVGIAAGTTLLILNLTSSPAADSAQTETGVQPVVGLGHVGVRGRF